MAEESEALLSQTREQSGNRSVTYFHSGMLLARARSFGASLPPATPERGS